MQAAGFPGTSSKTSCSTIGGYEGDYAHQADSGVLSIPAALQLTGDLSGSANPIYDPNTGAANGTGRTPFANKIIPQSRISPVVQKLIPHFPATNLPGVVNNYYLNRTTVYNLHKIDTKVDYTATEKLRFSGRYGYQPFYNLQNPIYGDFLGGSGGFASSGAGNYLQNGATLAISGSGTYVMTPTFVVDATFGVTQAHQLLFPTSTNERVGSDVLGIPGTNLGKLPWAGGLPNFVMSNFVTFGYSYTPLEYKDPIFEYTANATKSKGSHTIRFGFDLSRQHQNHIEINPTAFTFSGNVTALSGGPGANVYNQLGDFLLGLPTSMGNSTQAIQPDGKPSHLGIRSLRPRPVAGKPQANRQFRDALGTLSGADTGIEGHQHLQLPDQHANGVRRGRHAHGLRHQGVAQVVCTEYRHRVQALGEHSHSGRIFAGALAG